MKELVGRRVVEGSYRELYNLLLYIKNVLIGIYYGL